MAGRARILAPAAPHRIRRIVLLASRFHAPLVRRLVEGARRFLRRAGVPASCIHVVWVPGTFELPVAAARLARRRPRPDAIIALGALLRGETAQYELLAHATLAGLTHVAVTHAIPVACGVIVAATPAQARARAGGRMGNRGEEAAAAALAVLEV